MFSIRLCLLLDVDSHYRGPHLTNHRHARLVDNFLYLVDLGIHDDSHARIAQCPGLFVPYLFGATETALTATKQGTVTISTAAAAATTTTTTTAAPIPTTTRIEWNLTIVYP